MTGRLDRVDLASDLVLVILEHRGEPVPLDELGGAFLAVDPDPWVFDPRSLELGDVVDAVRIFLSIGLVDVDETGDVPIVELTGTGENMARHLVAALERDQAEAVGREVGV